MVPVIPLARSEAMKAATLAISLSVESRFPWLRAAINSRNCSHVMPHAFAWSAKTSWIVSLSGMPVGRRPRTRMPFGASSADRLRVRERSYSSLAATEPPSRASLGRSLLQEGQPKLRYLTPSTVRASINISTPWSRRRVALISRSML